MKKLLIIGTARNEAIDFNLLKIKTVFRKKDWEYSIFLTKEYKNDLIDKYIFFDKKIISQDDIYDFSEFDEIVVCQSTYVRYDFLNIYNFLKNNKVKWTFVIYPGNKLKKFNILKKIKKIYIILLKFLIIYRIIGF
ncbi:MAG: hypothetical protein M0R46_01665 [Candidatus Muirbacterium halophilum]|nr:hypothetical protein [Candidatus Muirbacterium halophilum]MCK9474603.1 hypothetical protein [Candidatus Muirbacterium halophilum]